jgi:hypothetical protein
MNEEIGILGLVAIVSIMVTLLTYVPKEGFLSQEDAVQILSGLTGDQASKSQYLNDPKLFDIRNDCLEIRMPVRVDRELRVIGKDCKVEGYTKKGKIVGMGLNSKNADQSNLNVISSTNKGAVPLKFYVITQDGAENVVSELAGHRFNYKTHDNHYIPGYPKNYIHSVIGIQKFKNKQDALYACDAHPYCKGVTYDKRTRTHTLRGNSTRIHNGMRVPIYRNRHETSYAKIL